jgi:hypothetical protein
VRGRPAARRGIVGRRLRRQHRSACEHHDAGVVVRSRHYAEHDGLGARHRASPPKKWSGRGRPPKLIRRDAKHRPRSVKALARDLPKRAWRTIEWREGTAERLSSRFALVRVRVAHRDYQLTDNRPEEWLLIEWPEGEKEPTKYWLSTLPESSGRLRQVALAHRARLPGAQAGGRPRPLRRTRTARLPPPRHAVRRSLRVPDLRAETIPPSGPRSDVQFPPSALPDGYRPRGSAPASRTAHSELNRNRAPTTDCDSRPEITAMSMLPRLQPQDTCAHKLYDAVRL